MKSTRVIPLLAVLAVLTVAVPAEAGVNSLFINGLGFFDTGDLRQASDDLGAGNLSPGYDGDFLLTFRDSHRTSVLTGFGIFWSRRSEKDDPLPFEAPTAPGRIEILGFPFTVGFARRGADPDRRGWVWGAMGHYYYVKLSVDSPPGLEPSFFRVSGSEGERNAEGPALSAFAAYEYPFFLGRAGVGVKARYAWIDVDDEAGLSTPDFGMTGVTLFVSAALR